MPYKVYSDMERHAWFLSMARLEYVEYLYRKIVDEKKYPAETESDVEAIRILSQVKVANMLDSEIEAWLAGKD